MELEKLSKQELYEAFFKASDAYFDAIGAADIFYLRGTSEFQNVKQDLEIILDEMTRRKASAKNGP